MIKIAKILIFFVLILKGTVQKDVFGCKWDQSIGPLKRVGQGDFLGAYAYPLSCEKPFKGTVRRDVRGVSSGIN
jgi:hypothetical protein